MNQPTHPQGAFGSRGPSAPGATLADIARQMQAGIAAGRFKSQAGLLASQLDGQVIRVAGRIRRDLVAVIEQDGEHWRLTIGRPDRQPSLDEEAAFHAAFGLSLVDEPQRRVLKRRSTKELSLVMSLDAVASIQPAVWYLTEFRWIEIETP